LPLNLEENVPCSSHGDIDSDNGVNDSECEMDSPKPLRLYPKRQTEISGIHV